MINAEAKESKAYNYRFTTAELAWTGRRQRRSFGGLVAGAAVLASIIYVTGWQRQMNDAEFILCTGLTIPTGSSFLQSVKGRVCPFPATILINSSIVTHLPIVTPLPIVTILPLPGR